MQRMGLLDYFRAMGRGLMFWRAPPSLDTQADLAVFCAEQSAYMAQTNLYGYLRTRAGLQHFNLFNDKKFTALLRPARTKLVLICLEDLTLYAVAAIVDKGADKEQAEKLANMTFSQAVDEVADDSLPSAAYQTARDAFAAQLPHIEWAARLSPTAFEKSTAALIELAPIVDELKNYDTEIVSNSMRFKWMGVRAELARRLDAPRLLASLA